MSDRYRLLQAGQRKFSLECDIVYLVKTMRKVSMLMNAVLDEHDRRLEAFQYTHTLNTLDGVRHSQKDYASDLPKMIERKSNEEENQIYTQHINEFINSYFEMPLEVKNMRLIKGVYSTDNLLEKEIKQI